MEESSNIIFEVNSIMFVFYDSLVGKANCHSCFDRVIFFLTVVFPIVCTIFGCPGYHFISKEFN